MAEEINQKIKQTRLENRRMVSPLLFVLSDTVASETLVIKISTPTILNLSGSTSKSKLLVQSVRYRGPE